MNKDLIHKHKKLIDYEVSKHSTHLPKTRVYTEAYKLAHKAANTFDPNKGTQFSTHLNNHLRKLSRLSTRYGGEIRLPEDKQFRVHRINQTEEHLKAELGRDPSVSEVADGTGMSISEVNSLLKGRKKTVNLNNLAYSPVMINEEENDDWLHFVYHDLTDRDKIIFEHKTGFGGRKILTNKQLAKKLKVSQSTIGYRSKLINNQLATGFKSPFTS